MNFQRKYYNRETDRIYRVNAAIAQLVEHIHGKDEVSGSSPDGGSRRFYFVEQDEKCEQKKENGIFDDLLLQRRIIQIHVTGLLVGSHDNSIQ